MNILGEGMSYGDQKGYGLVLQSLMRSKSMFLVLVKLVSPRAL